MKDFQFISLSLLSGWSKTKRYHGFFKPSARLVSSRIISTEEVSPDHHCTHMLMQWGQFVDHDLDHALPSVSSESFHDGESCQRYVFVFLSFYISL